KKQLTRQQRALTVAPLEQHQSRFLFMTIRFVQLWLWISAVASAAGWGLSAVGQLNRIGYAFFIVGAFIFLWLGRGLLDLKAPVSPAGWNKWKRRMRRPLPCILVVLAVLAFVGGALYPPTNHTGLSYRAPLVLFTRSDRLLFLLNFIPFVLLPGQIFSLWTRLGVQPRVAWQWMWLLP